MKTLILFFFCLEGIIYTFTDTTSIVSINYSVLSETHGTDIELTIKNNSKDTLLTLLEPFIICGLNQEKFSYPISAFSPNIVYVFKEKISFWGDGSFEYLFSNFPKICIINPFKSIYIILHSPSKIPEGYITNGFIKYCLKSNLDSNLVDFKPEIANEYNKSLITKDTIIANLYTLSSIKDSLLFYKSAEQNHDLKFSKVIWMTFTSTVWEE